MRGWKRRLRGIDMKTLYLYGPPACGKTTLAKRLAAECGRMYLDLDEEIEAAAGDTVAGIFAKRGEAEFRRLESEALRRADAPIVALGGGTLLNPANRRFAESRGIVAVLETPPEEIARRVAAAAGTRPLGDKAAERREHYASFRRRIRPGDKVLLPRLLRGAVVPPPSKSHLHRLLTAEFLAGGGVRPARAGDCDDIRATIRCLRALGRGKAALDAGESGSTLRFLAPVAAALGIKAQFARHGRLADRPSINYETLEPGVHELPGDVSSQFATGLLFALPLLDGDSEIRFTTPLQSRGYVEMTLDVLALYGIRIEPLAGEPGGFRVPGGQKYVSPGPVEPEADWSAAAFWHAANALGSELRIESTRDDSRQPDRAIVPLLEKVKRGGRIDVSGCPDNYPALAAVNFALGAGARFTGTRRLRLKESDRIAAMEALFKDPTYADPQGDHRIAMAAGILSTVADGPTIIRGADCVAKSYPGFWDVFRLDLYAVAGWPLETTGSPAIHNAAHAAAGRRAEMVAWRVETAAEAMRLAERCNAKGMAVTIPHKEAAIPFLDSLDPAAAEIGAVNTVVFRDGRKLGFNTDEPGFAEAIQAFAGRDIAGMKAALLGAGGAAKAAGRALRRLGAEVVTFHRRPLEPGFNLIVNATPTDPIPEYRFDGTELLYDLRYVPATTPLMERAAAAGCRVSNGFGMLLAQAARQLEIFASPHGTAHERKRWKSPKNSKTAP